MIFLDSTTTIRVSNLKNRSGDLIDNASIVATISDLDGNSLFTVDLSSLGSGNYSGDITPANTVGLVAHAEYEIKIVASVDETIIDSRRELHTAQYRGFDELA